jgi:prophage maintenance system killer protein
MATSGRLGCCAVLNGADVTASQDEKYEAVLALAAGETTEEAFAQWLREHFAGAG